MPGTLHLLPIHATDDARPDEASGIQMNALFGSILRGMGILLGRCIYITDCTRRTYAQPSPVHWLFRLVGDFKNTSITIYYRHHMVGITTYIVVITITSVPLLSSVYLDVVAVFVIVLFTYRGHCTMYRRQHRYRRRCRKL